MSFEEVYNLFLIYTGLNCDEGSKYSFFCTNAINYLQGELIDINVLKDNGWRLDVAAASLAFYEYSRMLSVCDNVDTFKAGDITINNKNNLDSAKEMWLSEKAKIAFLLKDKDFLFKKV